MIVVKKKNRKWQIHDTNKGVVVGSFTSKENAVNMALSASNLSNQELVIKCK